MSSFSPGSLLRASGAVGILLIGLGSDGCSSTNAGTQPDPDESPDASSIPGTGGGRNVESGACRWGDCEVNTDEFATCMCGPCSDNNPCMLPLAECNLANGRCETDPPCASHTECGPRAYCNDSGNCRYNYYTGPCDTSDDCISPEENECRFGRCGCDFLHRELALTPNVLVVLDRSDSMNEPLGTSTKWSIAKEAITDAVSRYGDRVRFGLALYPGQDLACGVVSECSSGAVLIDPGAGSVGAFEGALSTASTCRSGTPTAEMLQSLLSYGPFGDTDRESYVLLVTDGVATCSDPLLQVDALGSRTPPVKTFVVGFGDGVDGAALDALADAGGTARDGTPKYYQAETATEIHDAFDDVVQRTFSCRYPFLPTWTYFSLDAYFGSEPVPQDRRHIDGWDYEAPEVVFYGDACRRLLSGEVSSFTVVATECGDTTH
jgi:hypothetical protein